MKLYNPLQMKLQDSEADFMLVSASLTRLCACGCVITWCGPPASAEALQGLEKCSVAYTRYITNGINKCQGPSRGKQNPGCCDLDFCYFEPEQDFKDQGWLFLKWVPAWSSYILPPFGFLSMQQRQIRNIRYMFTLQMWRQSRGAVESS